MLAAILKETQITNLRCAPSARMFAFASERPLTSCSLTILAPPLTHSLGGKDIGVEGASALAAVLKETQIKHLGCAIAPQSVRFCVSVR